MPKHKNSAAIDFEVGCDTILIKNSTNCTKLELFIDKIYPVFAEKIDFELLEKINKFLAA